jgi:hypothetical protein
MHAGDFIKWTSEDEDGKFSHVGQIISQNDVWIEFQTVHGVMFVQRNDGKFEPHAPIKLAVTDKPKAGLDQPKRDVKSGSKLERCLTIYKRMKEASRKDLIAAFVDEVGMTQAGASTYAAQVRKMV